jgi:hypothetical protein
MHNDYCYLGSDECSHQATGWTTEESELDSWHEQEIFIVSNIAISALGFTRPPIWKLPGLHSPGVMGPGREPDYCHQMSRFRISTARLTVPKMPLWRSHEWHYYYYYYLLLLLFLALVLLSCPLIKAHWIELNYWWRLRPTARRCRFCRFLHANHKSPLHVWGFLYLLALCINHLGLAREEMPPAQNT